MKFDASLCRFWYSCFGITIRIRLMFLIIFLSDMHLSDFLINVIFRASWNDKKVIQLVHLIFKIYRFSWQHVANSSIFCGKFFILLWRNLGLQFSTMPASNVFKQPNFLIRHVTCVLQPYTHVVCKIITEVPNYRNLDTSN